MFEFIQCILFLAVVLDDMFEISTRLRKRKKQAAGSEPEECTQCVRVKKDLISIGGKKDKEIATLRKKLEKLDAKHNNLVAEAVDPDVSQQVAKMAQAAKELEVKLAAKQNAESELTAKIKAARDDMADLQAELQNQVLEKQRLINFREEQIAQQEKAFADLKIESKTAESDRIRAVSGMQAQIFNLRKDVKNLEQLLQTQLARTTELEGFLKIKDKRLEGLQNKAADLEATNIQLQIRDQDLTKKVAEASKRQPAVDGNKERIVAEKDKEIVRLRSKLKATAIVKKEVEKEAQKLSLFLQEVDLQQECNRIDLANTNPVSSDEE